MHAMREPDIPFIPTVAYLCVVAAARIGIVRGSATSGREAIRSDPIRRRATGIEVDTYKNITAVRQAESRTPLQRRSGICLPCQQHPHASISQPAGDVAGNVQRPFLFHMPAQTTRTGVCAAVTGIQNE